MRRYFLVFAFLFSNFAFPQINLIWNSSSINYNTISGWVDFEKSGSVWKKRIYQIDSTSFRIMTEGFSLTPQYTYTFNQNEILAGMQLYSTSGDLNGNGIMDFYVLAYYGTSPYRQSVKILDVSTNQLILERNDASFYFSYPLLEDINNDGLAELIFTKYDYPAFNGYAYEVYSTPATGIEEISSPGNFHLYQNFPNPFNPSTTIKYTLPSESSIQLKIFDIKGELIKSMTRDKIIAGDHEIAWDGTNDKGVRQPSGVYVYQLKVNNSSSARKMILLK
jgi:hypothetical protein